MNIILYSFYLFSFSKLRLRISKRYDFCIGGFLDSKYLLISCCLEYFSKVIFSPLDLFKRKLESMEKNENNKCKSTYTLISGIGIFFVIVII